MKGWKKLVKTSKRAPVRSTKVVVDGIQFNSKLEAHMYGLLKKYHIKAEYEPITYTLSEGFNFDRSCYETTETGKGKNVFIDRGHNKVQSTKYTPDFVGDDFIIEVKGRANDFFPAKWRLFKKYIMENKMDVTLYKPKNEDQCLEVALMILQSIHIKKGNPT